MAAANELVLVTGASGYIASHAVRHLLDAGYVVRGTVRKKASSKCAHLQGWIDDGAALTLVEADLMDADSWLKADVMESVTMVLHMASPVMFGVSKKQREKKLVAPARDGTLNVLRAAASTGACKRVVITSSIAAIMGGHPFANELDKPEERWTNIEDPNLEAYFLSKAVAERAAWDFVEEQGNPFELVTLLPAFVYGAPLSRNGNESNDVLRKLLRLPVLPDFCTGVVAVQDVALAHRLALERPEAAGERILLQAQSANLLDLAKALRPEFRKYGYMRLPTLRAPYWALRIIALFDTEIRATLPDVGKGERNMSVSKAETLLGISEWIPGPDMVVDHAHAALRMKCRGFPQTKSYKAFLKRQGQVAAIPEPTDNKI